MKTERDYALAKMANAIRSHRDAEWSAYLVAQGILGFTAPPVSEAPEVQQDGI